MPSGRSPAGEVQFVQFPIAVHSSNRASHGASDAEKARYGGRWSAMQSDRSSQPRPVAIQAWRHEQPQTRLRVEYHRDGGKLRQLTEAHLHMSITRSPMHSFS